MHKTGKTIHKSIKRFIQVSLVVRQGLPVRFWHADEIQQHLQVGC